MEEMGSNWGVQLQKRLSKMDNAYSLEHCEQVGLFVGKLHLTSSMSLVGSVPTYEYTG